MRVGRLLPRYYGYTEHISISMQVFFSGRLWSARSIAVSFLRVSAVCCFMLSMDWAGIVPWRDSRFAAARLDEIGHWRTMILPVWCTVCAQADETDEALS